MNNLFLSTGKKKKKKCEKKKNRKNVTLLYVDWGLNQTPEFMWGEFSPPIFFYGVGLDLGSRV